MYQFMSIRIMERLRTGDVATYRVEGKMKGNIAAQGEPRCAALETERLIRRGGTSVIALFCTAHEFPWQSRDFGRRKSSLHRKFSIGPYDLLREVRCPLLSKNDKIANEILGVKQSCVILLK